MELTFKAFRSVHVGNANRIVSGTRFIIAIFNSASTETNNRCRKASSRTDYLGAKIATLEEAKQQLEIWKLSSKKVVFTNGCFDILHKGHVTYLAQAAQQGNRLVLGLNTDASVKRQGKGDDRPINDEDARGTVLAAMSFVDLIVFFR